MSGYLALPLRVVVSVAVLVCSFVTRSRGLAVHKPYFRHGLAYPYRDYDYPGRARVWLRATLTCRHPHHEQVLRNYSKFYSPELVEEFWSPAGEVDDREKRRYFISKRLVAGAEGTVYEAVDLRTGKLVAIKKMTNVFNDTHLASQVWTEARVLEMTRVSPDIMRLNRVLKPKTWRTFNTVYIVLDMLEIGVPPGGHPQSADILERSADKTLRRRVFQYIRGVAFLHEANLVHNDLKWHNVMLDEECNAVLIDLGNLTPVREVPENAVMEDFPIFGDFGQFRRDIWMMGSTILSWLGGTDFHIDVSETPTNKAKLIVNALGFPPDEYLAHYSAEVQAGFAEAKKSMTELTSLRQRFPEVDYHLFDLLHEMMRFDRKVKSAKEYLYHPYFAKIEEEVHIASVHEANVAKILQDGHDKCYESERAARWLVYELALRNQ